MNSVVRWLIVALAVAHGLIHFLGVAAGFGWASVPKVGGSVSVGMGVVWLGSGVLVLAAGAVIAGKTWSRWRVVALAAVASQVAIATAWTDAKAGTAVNVLLLAVAARGFSKARQLGSRPMRQRRPVTR